MPGVNLALVKGCTNVCVFHRYEDLYWTEAKCRVFRVELSCTVVIMIIMGFQHKVEQRNSSALVEFCTRVSSVVLRLS